MPEESNANPSLVERREIRVFISSTFRDMQEEREELVKQIFPQLRRLCESRGVTWGEVDLRWGVPDEAKSEGKVLPLCLAEIEHCRPYFIGLLGERYGWVPEEIPQELIVLQPWLNEHRKQSVTALEILHGVLLNPKMAEHAFFYFRDPRYAAEREGFTEEDDVRRERLAVLKDDIRKSSFPVAENFSTPKQLGEWVLRDLTAVIENLYPERSIPDPLDRDAADHEAYAASRRRVYIGRQKYIERLDAHAAGDGPPLVVLGESGGGKSALLANWTHRWREQHSEPPVLVHFIGAAPDSANWIAMLRRLLGEFQRKFGLQVEIPDQPDALRMAFANALHMAAAHGRVVLVLDALNQIEDRDGALDLVWLPPVIPANVRLVVSTLPGRPLDDLQKRGWPVLTIEPLTAVERETLIAKYLKLYAKELSAERRSRIAAAPQSGNGLYLSTLLNELRLFGSYDELDKRIDWYLEAANPFELYRKVIQRWEQDYGKPDPACENVVRESLVRLWAARRGLSESELLESLGTEGTPLPRALWSPLYLAAGDALVNRRGLLTFAHEFLREAVSGVYLPLTEDKQSAHRTLARYFHDQPQGARRLDELPWQMAEANSWQELSALLTDLSFFVAAWGANEQDVRRFWTRVEESSTLRLLDAFGPLLAEPEKFEEGLWEVSLLCRRLGYARNTLPVWQLLVQRYSKSGDYNHLQGALGNTGVCLMSQDLLDEAQQYFKQQELLCRKIGNMTGLQESLGNQAAALVKCGKLDLALPLMKEEEAVCRGRHNIPGLCAALGNQARVMDVKGKHEEALKILAEQERLCRQSGNQSLLQHCFGAQAQVCMSLKQFSEAGKLLREREALCRPLGDKDGLAGVMQGLAIVEEALGNINSAVEHLRAMEQLGRELHDPSRIAYSLIHRADLLAENLRRPHEALSLITEAMRLVEVHKLELLRRPSESVSKLVHWLCERPSDASPRQDSIAGDSGNAVHDRFWSRSEEFLDFANSLTVTCCGCGEVTSVRYKQPVAGFASSPALGMAFPATCANCLAELLICYRAGRVVHVERITGPSGLVAALKRAQERLALNKGGQC